MMRLVPLLLLCGMTSILQAQIVDDYQPDSDGDGCIGMSDLLSLLSVFGTCEAQPFACGDPINYQGYDYATVQIGEQCWFAENLRSENYANGDEIPANLSDSEWSSTTSGALAVYGEGSSTCSHNSPDGDGCDEAWSLDEFGRLYNLYAVDDVRGLCPSGWHVPTDVEWQAMTNELDGESVAGVKMKSTSGWHNGGNGSNSSGFLGLPGGSRSTTGFFSGAGEKGSWWGSSNFGTNVGCRSVNYYDGEVDHADWPSQSGASVRCIQDSEE